MNTISPQLDLDAANAVLDTYDPAKIVAWSARQFGDGLLTSSSFGAESATLIHLATQTAPRIRIVTIDTGYLFAETHEFLKSLRERFKLNVIVYRSRNDPDGYLRAAGENDPTVRQDIGACCAANKNEPFERAMREQAPAAWLRGIRRDQSTTRQNRAIIEWSDRYNCYAISPLLNWTTRQVHEYMKANDLPHHPLYEKGYRSIGCSPVSCTIPVTIGTDSRAGRWAREAKTECGLHLERAL
jgi:phosphoadenosine phosphosulfate reductase